MNIGFDKLVFLVEFNKIELILQDIHIDFVLAFDNLHFEDYLFLFWYWSFLLFVFTIYGIKSIRGNGLLDINLVEFFTTKLLKSTILGVRHVRK